MVDDLKIIIDLAKKKSKYINIYTMGHSIGGHVNALFQPNIQIKLKVLSLHQDY